MARPRKALNGLVEFGMGTPAEPVGALRGSHCSEEMFDDFGARLIGFALQLC